MSLHVIVLLYPHGAQERGCTACVWSVLLSGWSGCRAVSAAVRPLCAVGLSGSCQAVTLGPDSDRAPLMSDSAVRLSDTCCQAVREVLSTLSEAVGHCQALSGVCCQAVRPGLSCALPHTGGIRFLRVEAAQLLSRVRCSHEKSCPKTCIGTIQDLTRFMLHMRRTPMVYR